MSSHAAKRASVQDAPDSYQQLTQQFEALQALQGVMGILHWDSAVIMPESAATVRGQQMAALGQIKHDKLTDPRMGEWLSDAGANAEKLDDWQRANLTEMTRIWQHATACDVRLVREQAVATSESEVFWRTARKENNFKGFLPYLKRVVALVREEAAMKADALKLAPYDALMDGYDSGTRMAEVDPIFETLSSFLPGMREQAMDFQAKHVSYLELQGGYAITKQQALSDKLARDLGFKGRLDISTHPFCGGAPGDVRMTTRYREEDFVDALQGVLHETGHALYEQNLPAEWRFQPVGRARGMSTHESQSLLVEMQFCRSREYLSYATPLIREKLGTSEAAVNAENLYRLGTRVKPGLIRVRADEVCYPSHVILRYRLEKDIISGKLDVADLPEAWRALMQEMLGITPPNDADGCMQDIHWPGGSFGYFPTYTLGAMMAAQWFAQVKKDVPHVMNDAANGKFGDFTAWLNQHVHARASSVSRQQLLKDATGQGLDVNVYIQHLKDRYLA